MIEAESKSYPTIVQLVTTVDTREAAESIAHDLVAGRLAGCVQIGGPVCSTYSWQGSIEQSMEFRLTIKTTKKMLDRLVEKLTLLHPYETPEILWSEVSSTESYCQWLKEYLSSQSN
ncbi:MAG: divalent-cation tolerance protein CutA [Pirellula sp.]|nr:divalent-cation tolerance protein CutA [Pirellula sp.]